MRPIFLSLQTIKTRLSVGTSIPPQARLWGLHFTKMPLYLTRLVALRPLCLNLHVVMGFAQGFVAGSHPRASNLSKASRRNRPQGRRAPDMTPRG